LKSLNHFNENCAIVYILPAFILHSAANFRGSKPLYVWDSTRPWDEVQLQVCDIITLILLHHIHHELLFITKAWGAPDNASALNLLVKSSMNLLWFLLLFRTFIHAIRQYMLFTRYYYVTTSISRDLYQNDRDKTSSDGK
jgi:hypothetical protein